LATGAERYPAAPGVTVLGCTAPPADVPRRAWRGGGHSRNARPARAAQLAESGVNPCSRGPDASTGDHHYTMPAPRWFRSWTPVERHPTTADLLVIQLGTRRPLSWQEPPILNSLARLRLILGHASVWMVPCPSDHWRCRSSLHRFGNMRSPAPTLSGRRRCVETPSVPTPRRGLRAPATDTDTDSSASPLPLMTSAGYRCLNAALVRR
jgi:hypothetical protein